MFRAPKKAENCSQTCPSAATEKRPLYANINVSSCAPQHLVASHSNNSLYPCQFNLASEQYCLYLHHPSRYLAERQPSHLACSIECILHCSVVAQLCTAMMLLRIVHSGSLQTGLSTGDIPIHSKQFHSFVCAVRETCFPRITCQLTSADFT
jgi:hypothetical protein